MLFCFVVSSFHYCSILIYYCPEQSNRLISQLGLLL